MSTIITLDDLQEAWKWRDPRLAQYFVQLVEQPDPTPEPPPREGALSFDAFLREIGTYKFRTSTRDEQMHYRTQTLKLLESPDAEIPLTPKLRSYAFIMALWESDDPFARRTLLEIISTVPFVYGPWKALKKIFKEAEAKHDTEIFGALCARIDGQFSIKRCQVSHKTLGYLARRGWRYLRHVAQSLPGTYADVACDFLAAYDNEVSTNHSWIFNHLLYHESDMYGRVAFRINYWQRPEGGPLKNRAYAELWQRSPRPLFNLLERAQNNDVIDYATEALKADFRNHLREIDVAWVTRLSSRPYESIHRFIVWILSNVPKFEQSKFRDLGLHETVLRLFDSPADDARTYAANYARTYARDLAIDQLILLANNSNEDVRKLAADLLLARDARKDVGLGAWGELLETYHGNELAAKVLLKHFGAKELTPEWFAKLFLSSSDNGPSFAREQLLKIHPANKLGPGYFADIYLQVDIEYYWASSETSEFLAEQIVKSDLGQLAQDTLRLLLVHPRFQATMFELINQGKIDLKKFAIDFLKMLSFHPAWEADPWVLQLRGGRFKWSKDNAFNELLADQLLAYFADVRRFTPQEVGMDWLLLLVQRSETRYHQFAVERLIKSFAPADFAPGTATPEPVAEASAEAVDFNKATFLFTGKLATMVRKEAEDKVKTANGVLASSVTKNLHYLVIGDEGSPLYGNGKKGDKQTKAEDLNEKGANIKIISETAFLQMLVRGERKAESNDQVLAGCERLWAMVTGAGPQDAPLGNFARRYIRRHHPEIALAETDRPVDPGYEIPDSFLTFDRFKPLFSDSRRPLREFALEISKWEFSRWAPSALDLVWLCEMPFNEVRAFVGEALLADDHPKHSKYRIDIEQLSPAGVYAFCESVNPATRALGMQLIDRSPRLRVPEELFRLTESPDRQVRAFAIRSLWSAYRDRGVTANWKPSIPPQTTVSEAARKSAAQAAQKRGPGVPATPERRPGSDPQLTEFLRRILFEIPPGPPSPVDEADKAIFAKLKPLPARLAKLSLIEMLRDLALKDSLLTQGLTPVLEEFMHSFGVSERDACLVAVTQLKQQANAAPRAAKPNKKSPPKKKP